MNHMLGLANQFSPAEFNVSCQGQEPIFVKRPALLPGHEPDQSIFHDPQNRKSLHNRFVIRHDWVLG